MSIQQVRAQLAQAEAAIRSAATRLTAAQNAHAAAAQELRSMQLYCDAAPADEPAVFTRRAQQVAKPAAEHAARLAALEVAEAELRAAEEAAMGPRRAAAAAEALDLSNATARIAAVVAKAYDFATQLGELHHEATKLLNAADASRRGLQVLGAHVDIDHSAARRFEVAQHSVFELRRVAPVRAERIPAITTGDVA